MTGPPESIELLDTEEVRVALGLKTRQGVRDMIRRGALPAVRLGRGFKVRRTALLAVLEAQERSSQLPSSDTARGIVRRLNRKRRKK